MCQNFRFTFILPDYLSLHTSSPSVYFTLFCFSLISAFHSFFFALIFIPSLFSSTFRCALKCSREVLFLFVSLVNLAVSHLFICPYFPSNKNIRRRCFKNKRMNGKKPTHWLLCSQTETLLLRKELARRPHTLRPLFLHGCTTQSRAIYYNL